MNWNVFVPTFLCLNAVLWQGASHAGDFSVLKSNIGVEGYFYGDNGRPWQGVGSQALTGEAELQSRLGGNSSIKLTPFVRLDPNDNNRNRVDLREAAIELVNGPWYVYAGMGKLSWSTVESVNVIPIQTIDVVNQRDFSGDPTGQEKLGAAMLSASYQWDTVRANVYLLPWFRPRPMPSREARENPVGGLFDLNGDDLFTGGEKEYQPGFALRVEKVTSQANLAFIQYRGYAPQPITYWDQVSNRPSNLYYQVDMTGVTAQATLGQWLFKSEMAYMNTAINSARYAIVPKSYFSGVLGAEYTFVRVAGESDISALAEWIRNTQDHGPTGGPFSNDLFLGFRWVANDPADSQILGGVVRHLDRNDSVLQVQYESRLYDSYKLLLGIRAYKVDTNGPLAAFKNDSVIYAKLRYFF